MPPPDLLPAQHLPTQHPGRRALNDEAHARPSAPLSPPLDVSYVALLGDAEARAGTLAALRRLAAAAGIAPPPEDADAFALDFGRYWLRYERHTEFSRFAVSTPADPNGDPFARPAILALPEGWLASLPGELLVAIHLAFRDGDEEGIGAATATRIMGGAEPVGAMVLDGRGTAFTDFRIGPDGFSRMILLNHAMTAPQAGRTAQRLLEIETYRMLALLAFPVARALTPFLTRREGELAAITATMAPARSEDEAPLLARLTTLAAAIEAAEATNLNRFSASAAYYDLVRRRITELREIRIEGLANFAEFVERRLAPAMATCAAVAARHDALSRRVARATQLLSTRVELTRESQVLSVLASMDRRANMQLRLQQTVEGLSTAAITYYVVGLVGGLANGLGSARLGIEPGLVTALSIPVVALLVWLGIRRIRRRIEDARPNAEA